MSNEFVMVPREQLSKIREWIESARDGVLYPIARDFEGVVGRNAEGLGQETPALMDGIDELLSQQAEKSTGDPVAWMFKVRVHATGLGLVWREKIEQHAPDTEMVEVRDLAPLYTRPAPANLGEVERFERLYTKALSRQADIGVELAVSHELLRKAFFALLKGGHSKPLREQIKEILPIALCSTCNGYGKYQDGDSGTDEDGRAPNIVECDCDDSERMPQYRSNAEQSAQP